METKSRVYRIKVLGNGQYLISGHPEFCPEPTVVEISGSIFHQKGSMLKMHYIGRGMFLEFYHPTHGRIVTSEIQDVKEVPASA